MILRGGTSEEEDRARVNKILALAEECRVPGEIYEFIDDPGTTDTRMIQIFCERWHPQIPEISVFLRKLPY